MIFCQFKPHPDTPGRFLCERCNIPSSRNKTYGPEGPPPRHCPNPPDLRYPLLRLSMETQHPEILDQPDRYHQAVLQWAAEGFPVRDHEEIDNILAECTACPKYNDGTCSQCGAKGQIIVVKAHMKTESCPGLNWPKGDL